MDLREALAVRAGAVVAITGGGGKTTALYRLGAELADGGVPVLLTGTTRFTPPEGDAAPNLTLVESADALVHALRHARAWPVTAAAGWGSKGRLLPLDPAWLDRLHAEQPALAIIVEADGSAMRPFKAPGEHEPVIPPCSSLVVNVVGLDAIGRPLDETHVHRPERVAVLTGVAIGAPVTEAAVVTVMTHAAGGRKGVPPAARWAALLNKADTPQRRATAGVVAAALAPRLRGNDVIVVAQLKRAPAVLRVVEAAQVAGKT
jgi:probable selenium-dependent hydroxylase accessory protein YqeC